MDIWFLVAKLNLIHLGSFEQLVLYSYDQITFLAFNFCNDEKCLLRPQQINLLVFCEQPAVSWLFSPSRLPFFLVTCRHLMSHIPQFQLEERVFQHADGDWRRGFFGGLACSLRRRLMWFCLRRTK